MARTPRAKVSKTSGAGVSRLSYQRGYAMGNRGGGGKAPASDIKFESGDREYGKTKGEYSSKMNVSYGDTIFPSDIKDIEGAYKGKPAKGLNLVPRSAKKLT